MRWLLWTFAALFYFYEYILRVAPSTMVPELMSAFSINAAGIGALGGSFFFAYAPMQLPVGILMDRFGARKLLMFASIGCGAGALLFGSATKLSIAYTGFIFIGTAASFAFVAMVYVCSHWFEESKRALLVGLANSIAMLGGIFGEGPLSFFVHDIGWRWSMIFLGFIGFGLAFLIFLTIFKSSPKVDDLESNLRTHDEHHKFFEGLKIVACNRQVWIISIVALLYYTVTSALTCLWGISFMQTSYGVSKVTAGYAISMLFVGWMIGGPLWGAISDRLGNRKKIILWGIFLTLISLTLVLYWTSMPIILAYILMFMVGLFSAAQLLNFTFVTEINRKNIKGIAIAWTNFIVSIGSAGIIPLVGWLLDLFSIESLSTPEAYTQQDYKHAFLVLPISLALAWVLALFLDEKKRHKLAFSQSETMD